jgi:LmbE family N-acetylglucosaminyl deacetylase
MQIIEQKMNPYNQLVSTYARLAREGKSYPLGTFPVKDGVKASPDAPTALIFAPHPDDEVIIGALPLRLLQQSGWRVIDLAVTLGSKLERRSERLTELKACCHYIGFEVKPVAPNGLDKINPEGRKNNDLWKHGVDAVAKLLVDYKPQAIFFPHQDDWNTTHIGTHLLVADALAKMPEEFSCFTVETEFWAAMGKPNLMVELGEEELSDLVTALSFHVGEVKRNPYHLSLPAWMVDNVRRGSELIVSQGMAAPDFTFATLYKVQKWAEGQFQEIKLASHVLALQDNPASIFTGFGIT